MKKFLLIATLLVAGRAAIAQVNGTATFTAITTSATTFDYYVIPSNSFVSASGGISSLTIAMQAPGPTPVTGCNANAAAPVFTFSNLISGMTLAGNSTPKSSDATNTGAAGTSWWNIPYNFNCTNVLSSVPFVAGVPIKLCTVTIPAGADINCVAVIDFPNNRLAPGPQPFYGSYINIAVATGAVNENPAQMFNTSTSADGSTVPAATNGGSVASTSRMPLNWGSPLPVHLNSFNATAKDCNALITWQTGTEQSSDRYDIEYSANGHDFIRIGSLKSRNSSTGSSYSYTYSNLAGGNSFFRLKMMDFSGDFTYSNTIRVVSHCGGDAGLSNNVVVSPNPTTGTVLVSGLNSKSEIRVLNGLGQLVTEAVITENNTVQLSLADLANGTYFIRVTGEDGSSKTVQVIKK